MRLGYFTMLIHPPEREYAATLAEDREAILLADRLGFAEAYVGEHVTDARGDDHRLRRVPRQPRARHRAHHARHGHGEPVQQPSRGARGEGGDARTLLEGRFILGVSPGGLASDWEMFGTLSGVDRRARAQECMDHVIALWTGEAPYNLTGEHWTLSTARTLMPDLGQA